MTEDQKPTPSEVDELQQRQESKPVAQPAEGSAEAAAKAAATPPEATPAAAAPSGRPADPAAADDVLTRRVPGHEAADAAVLAESRRHTRRSFAAAAVAAAAGYSFVHYVMNAPADNDQPIPRRDAFDVNAAIARGITREHALTPTFPLSRAETLRVNGIYGLKKELVPESYRLQLVGVAGAAARPRFVPDVTVWQYRYTEAKSTEDQGHDLKTPPKSATAPATHAGANTPPANAGTADKMAPASMVADAKQREAAPAPSTVRGSEEAGESDSRLRPGTPGLLLTMADVLQLPRHELVTRFVCIEGWSQVVHWAGVRMRDFLELYPPALINGQPPKFVYMETPDGDYYTGYDMDVCRHPQTLLVTEMMGAPLTQFHGAPLRLHTPTKYGYKQIKRIGLIAYTNEKPDDYWTKLGYDWYAGL